MAKKSLAAAAILLVIGIFFLLRLRGYMASVRDWLPTPAASADGDTIANGELKWRPVDKTAQGFKVEMPGSPHTVSIPSENESGATEPVSMLQVKFDADRTFAVTWADKPPVARVNDLDADQTLNQARDGALARTAATTVKETPINPQGFPGRDIEARNVAGGILDTRLIYARPRLYMLIATSPSLTDRHEDDITRFFDSFTLAAKPASGASPR